MLLGTGYSSSLRLPFVSVFVPLVVSNLFPYFSIYCYSFLWVRLGRKVLLVFHLFLCLSPLLIHCSVFFVLVALGKRLSLCPICFCARLSACSQLVLTLLSSLLLFSLGASGAQDAHRMLLVHCLFPYLSSLLSPFRALLSFFLSFLFLSFFVSFSLSLSLLLSRCLLGPLILLVCHLFPYVSSLFSPSCILVSLVLSKLYPSFAPHCYSSLRLLWAECFSLLVFLRISLLACLCVLWDETYYPLHSLTLSLLHVSLQAVSLSSLHYRASCFSPLPFLSLLVPLVFPSAFFPSLLITVVFFGCFWDTGLSLSAVCFLILLHSLILVAFLGGYIV